MALKNNPEFQRMLAEVKPEENVFLIRGQDYTAPRTIVGWIHENIYNAAIPESKLREAFECALAMRRYPHRKSAD